jgi:hypothetical protein
VLDNAGIMSLVPIDEDDLDNAGTTVAHIIDSAGGDRITDVDPGAHEGIAIVGVDTAAGIWQFSTDGGATWHDVGSVADHHGLLLRESDLVRFQPAANFHGDIAAGLEFRAWDQTSGAAGGYADTTAHGGTSAFSSATEVAGLTVNSVNDAPVAGSPLIDHDVAQGHELAYQVAPDAFVDADAGDALTWLATRSDGTPLPDWLAFDPVTHTFSGTPANGDVGILAVKVTATDGAGASASSTFVITVANVNDAPFVVHPLLDQQVETGDQLTYQIPADAFADIDAGDSLSFSATLASGDALPGWLVFDPQTRTFSGQPGEDQVGTIAVRVAAQDQHGEQATDTFVVTVAAAPIVPPEPQDDAEPPAPSGWDPPVAPEPPHRGGPQQPADGSGADNADAPPAPPGSDSAAPDNHIPDSPAAGEPSIADDPFDSAASAETGDSGTAEPSGAGENGAGGSVSSPDFRADAGGQAADGHDGRAGAVGDAAALHGHDEHDEPHHYDGSEELEFEDPQFAAHFGGALLGGELLSDATQPIEFQEAWSTILGAYAHSSDELAAYLESAFRTVTESACVYQAADQAEAAAKLELEHAAELGIDVDADNLLDGLIAARQEVVLASTQLEQAIRAAARAGSGGTFDQVLDDVITSALNGLMTANEKLFVESHALAAAAAVLQDARLGGARVVDPNDLELAAAQARAAARHEMSEMRDRWDRVAQDVFSAFVARLVAERAESADEIPWP